MKKSIILLVYQECVALYIEERSEKEKKKKKKTLSSGNSQDERHLCFTCREGLLRRKVRSNFSFFFFCKISSSCAGFHSTRINQSPDPKEFFFVSFLLANRENKLFAFRLLWECASSLLSLSLSLVLWFITP